eukprot:3517050-Heterocapsa_arctica.AAC.1
MHSNSPPHSFANEATAAQALAHPWEFVIDPATGAPQRRGVEACMGVEGRELVRRDAQVSNRARQ